MLRAALLLFTVPLPLLDPQPACGHDGPDPLIHWDFRPQQLQGSKLKARLGVDIELSGPLRWSEDEFGHSLMLTPRTAGYAQPTGTAPALPAKALTVSAWVSVDEPLDWGGIIGRIQDDGDQELGWMLGFDRSVFTLTISTSGADDGNGRHTVLKGSTPWVRGRFHHVAAVFDGQSARLYVDGREEAFTAEQYGEILYPAAQQVSIGSFRDGNEDHRMTGRLRDIRIFDLAAKPEWVRLEFEHGVKLASLAARPVVSASGFAVEPYLQFGTQTSMTIMWRTAQPGSTLVRYGATAACEQEMKVEGLHEIHQVLLQNLEPETQYFYTVE
ncbi:MAG: LamG-like jellyroll fold domain-containing protein, partial [Planctomycetaceae bacterium]